MKTSDVLVSSLGVGLIWLGLLVMLIPKPDGGRPIAAENSESSGSNRAMKLGDMPASMEVEGETRASRRVATRPRPRTPSPRELRTPSTATSFILSSPSSP